MDFDHAIHQIAEHQHALVAHHQAVAAGGTEGAIQHRTRARRWLPVHRGVYRMAGSPPTWHQQVLAAVLARPDAVASHASAAALWNLPGYRHGPVEITVPYGRDNRLRGVVMHRSRRISALDTTVRSGVPVTTIARTLADLAARVTVDRLEELVHDALRRRLVSLAALQLVAHGLGRRAGMSRLWKVIDRIGDEATVPHSVFESRLIAMLRRAGVEEPERQVKVEIEGLGVICADFGWVPKRILIEADSIKHHGAPRRRERDRGRTNRVAAHGWTLLRITWLDMTEFEDELIALIRTAHATADQRALPRAS